MIAAKTRPLSTLLAALTVVLAACGGPAGNDGSTGGTTASISAETTSKEAAPSDAGPSDPLEVDVSTETFVDTSRPTAAGTETSARDERSLVTRIAHPTSGGPYPLIVLSHGLTGHPDEYADTVPMWASDGFVVVSPTFPLTNREVPGAFGNLSDVANQPGDISFVIDQILEVNADPANPLHGLVDPDAIGVVGHSLGGATTWAISFNTATHDPRVDSAVIFAGLTLPMPEGEFTFDSGLPLLVLHGDKDDVPLDSDLAAYEQAVPPKWFVTLHGADHVPPFTDDRSPYDELVTQTVLDFWHGTLDDDERALERVTADATDPTLTTVRHE
jgi:dienelactone hydrolase